MERNDGLRRLLSLAPVYRGVQRLIGGDRAVAFVRDVVLRSGDDTAVVDIGCGTADMADHMSFRSYVGFDPNPSYVQQAGTRLTARCGDRARVFVGSIGDAATVDQLPGGCDLVMMVGVLLHLDDRLADEALALAARLAGPTGRFASMDPGYADGQSKVARFLASRDRGQHVRTADQLRDLVGRHFGSVELTVRHDVLRMPYTHLAIDANNR